MSAPYYELPETIQLDREEYRLISRALERSADIVADSGWDEDSGPMIQAALLILLHRIWPELGELDDGGTLPVMTDIRLLNMRQLADRLGVDLDTAVDLVFEGELPPRLKKGEGRLHVLESDVEAYETRHSEATTSG